MNSPRCPLKIIRTGALVALVILAWVNFGPRQLGGPVSYVMTHGISMQPRVHEGDLVIVRESKTYQPGDVIAYQSAELHQPVMHRIVDQDDKGYITKGDNNDWLDIDRPTDADVIGKEWLHIPKAGKVLAALGVPRNAAALTGAAGFFLFRGTDGGRRRRKRSERQPVQAMTATNFQRLDPARQAALGVVALVALFSLLLGVLSFTKQPVTAVSQESAYSHQGSFEYEADARTNAVYPDGEANTRGPLFLKLIDDIQLSFSYTLASEAKRDISGTAALRARVNDDHGWQTTIPLQTPKPFRGSKVEVSGALDPQEIVKLTTEVQTLTGIPGSYTVTIVPVIDVAGTVGGEAIAETFQPELPFALDGLQMTAVSSDPAQGQPDPFKPSKPGSIKVSELAENRIFIGPLSSTVPTARKVSIVGLGLALLVAFILWRSFSRSLNEDAAAEIEARYGTWLVPITETAAVGAKAVQVADMESLVRLADRYERMILHATSEGNHSYIVQENGVDYIFRLDAAPGSGDLPQAPVVRSAESRSSMLPREGRRRTQRDELREHLREQLRDLEADIAAKQQKSDPDAG